MIRKATAPDREDRYATAAEMASALEGLIVDLGEPSGRRALGQLIATHFADERAHLHRLIDERLRATSLTEGSSSPPASSAEVHLSSNRSTTPAAFVGRTVVVHAPARPRPGLTLGLVGGLLALAATIPSLVRHAAPAAAAMLMTPLTTAAAQAPAAPAATMVWLQVNATPATARIFLDDRLLSSNPFDGSFPIGSAEQSLRVEAPGYASRFQTIRLSGDRAMNIVLDPLPVEEAHPAPMQPARSMGKTRRLDKANPYRL